MYCECRTLRFFCHTLPLFPTGPEVSLGSRTGPDGGENSSLRVPSGTLTDEKRRAEASGSFAKKAQPSSAERHRDRRSHAPEPPPATGATSTGSVLPALAPRRISLFANRLQNLLGESSARRPPPLRLCKTPVGVPSGTAEAGDSTNRDKFSPKLRPHVFLRAMPPRRGGRPTPPPADGRCRSAREGWTTL